MSANTAAASSGFAVHCSRPNGQSDGFAATKWPVASGDRIADSDTSSPATVASPAPTALAAADSIVVVVVEPEPVAVVAFEPSFVHFAGGFASAVAVAADHVPHFERAEGPRKW